MSAPVPSCAEEVAVETRARIRSVLGRLASLDDVTEMRRLANLEARRAMRAGDEERSGYFLAIAAEATSILEAAICQTEAPLSSAAL